ncbi:hypothetical protein BH23DEI1_BH23DEI1_15060 [soil metagenome]
MLIAVFIPMLACSIGAWAGSHIRGDRQVRGSLRVLAGLGGLGALHASMVWPAAPDTPVGFAALVMSGYLFGLAAPYRPAADSEHE